MRVNRQIKIMFNIVYSGFVMKIKSKKTKLDKTGKMPTTKMIGKRLAELRQQGGLSQSELARRTGFAQNVISEYESGRTRMHGAVIARFVIALNVNANEMLAVGNIEERTPLKPISRKVQQRAEMLEDLPPLIKKHVLRTIDMLIKAAGV